MFKNFLLTIAQASGLTFGCVLLMADAATAMNLFLGREYQAQKGTVTGSIRSGDPASDAAFLQWLATAGLTTADVMSSLPSSGTAAVWGAIADPGSVSNFNISLGATAVNTAIAGWDTASQSQTSASGTAHLDGFGNNGSTLQSGAPRPGFASGSGSGSYIGTKSGDTKDGILNAVAFDLTGFDGGVYSFGIFGGDLETGAPGSPVGFLQLTFADSTTETIDYLPDSSLFPDYSFSSSGNNTSETYGNETGRFIGISGDRLITQALFVVGDDDQNDDADSEQLSFIAPLIFLNANGAPVSVATAQSSPATTAQTSQAIPTPALLPGLLTFGAALGRKKRQAKQHFKG